MRVKQVILSEDYIVANGNIEDNKVLMEDPFRNLGSITQIFKDDMSKARDIMGIIAEIKSNSELMA